MYDLMPIQVVFVNKLFVTSLTCHSIVGAGGSIVRGSGGGGGQGLKVGHGNGGGAGGGDGERRRPGHKAAGVDGGCALRAVQARRGLHSECAKSWVRLDHNIIYI